ncbi:putative PurR-regulated permease PerM [Roseibium hamelinense]|uniref:Putative PurR-regulated permease PerM n=1 Tax=Roseibium hamelinense TaxID=150831 RepID=A0A562STS0_9HYPH|nr:AI-2E family transporter [Roseibium hamelinense]MTI43032.1 AI-2E family transporter [Roseibium hamelinense]TWI84665.1 putative PurR-regulated permease PerM [Roseibium hamelinense]
MSDGHDNEQTLEPPRSQSVDAKVIDIAVRLGVLGIFAYFSLQLVAPFAVFMLWAVVLTVALYPAYRWLASRLGNREGLAAALITLIGLVIVIGPVALLVFSMVETLQVFYQHVSDGSLQVAEPPQRLADVPVVGKQISDMWALASDSLEQAITKVAPFIVPAGTRILSALASLSGTVLFFAISILISGFLFVPGPLLASGARRFADRIIAPRGAEFVDLAGATIRNVSRGVIGVAFLQSLLAGIVMVGFGVPYAGLLAFAALVLCIVQIGPALVIIPVVIWAWSSMGAVLALVFTVLMIPIMLVDNVLRPFLMARGLAVPMLVILIGVLGGTLTYGLIGLFLGPVVLSVFYELVVAWVKVGESERPAPDAEPYESASVADET